MFAPNSARIRKSHKPQAYGVDHTSCHIEFGVCGFKVMEPCLLTSKHFEMMRAVIAKVIKKTGRFWFRKFPHISQTKKPAAVRMGGGKGGHENFVAIVKAGAILVELDLACTDEEVSKIYKTLKAKLPCEIKLVHRNFLVS